MILTLHNADDVSARAIQFTRKTSGDTGYLENTLPPIGPSYGWVGFSQHSGLAIEIDGNERPGESKSTVFQSKKFTSLRLKLPSTAKWPANLHCYIATLPDTLTNLLDKAEEDRGLVQSVVENILEVGISHRRNLEEGRLNKALEPLDDKVAFNLLRGCIPVLRHLRLFDAEAALLMRALEIRPSNNLQLLLSMALTNAQDYHGAIEAASHISLDKSDPKFGAFEHHMRELKAFELVEKEISDLLVRKNGCRRRQSDRVAYCLHNALPHANGGYAIRSHAIAKSLISSGLDLIAIARPGFPSDGKYSPSRYAPKHSIDGVTYHFNNDFGRRGSAYHYIARSSDYFENIFRRENIGIVHAATNFWTALPAGIAAERLNLPFIYEVRSFWGMTREAREPGFLETPQASRDEALERITLSFADHVFTLTEAMRHHLSVYDIAPEKVVLAPNCVDADRFVTQGRNSELSRRFNIEPDDVVVGYIGAMLDYEGLDLLIEATAPILAQNPKIKMLLIGADPEKLKTASGTEGHLLRQISETGLGDQIQLAARIPNEATAVHYGLFDICAYPRRNHDICELVSPLKPLEAMAAGKAVVLSDVGGMQEMVSHGQTGLVCQPNNAKSLRDQLEQLINNPLLRDNMGKNARSFVRRERNWPKTVSAMIDVYSASRQSQD